MSYAQFVGTADATWQGANAYTRPASNAADASFYGLIYPECLLEGAGVIGAPSVEVKPSAAVFMDSGGVIGAPEIQGHSIGALLESLGVIGAPGATGASTNALLQGAGVIGKPAVQTNQSIALLEGAGVIGPPAVRGIAGSLVQAAEALSFWSLPNTVSTGKLTDYYRMAGVPRGQLEIKTLLSQPLTVVETIAPILPVSVADAVVLTGAAQITATRYVKAVELLRSADLSRISLELLVALKEQSVIRDAVAPVQTLGLSESVQLTLNALADVYFGAKALEVVKLQDTANRTVEYSRALREFVTLAEATGLMFSGALLEQLAVASAANHEFISTFLANENINVKDAQSVLVELTNKLAEAWAGADQLQMARVLELSEQLVVEATLLTGARGLLTERLGLVERAVGTLELVGYLKEVLTAREAAAFISALGLSETLSLSDTAVLDAVNVLLAKEPLALVALVGAVRESSVGLKELTRLTDLSGFRLLLGLQDTATLTSQTTLDFLRDLLLRETFQATDKLTPALEIATRLVELTRWAERAGPIWQAILADGFNLADFGKYSLQYLLRLREYLTLAGATAAQVEMLIGLAEIQSFIDYAGTTSFLSAVDQLQLESALFYGLVESLDEQVTLSDLAGVAIFVGLSLNDAVELADTSSALGEFFARAVAGLLFLGRMPLHEGDFTAWVFNTDNLGLTQYTNYNFNSFMECKGKMYGVREDGLYLLEGTTDTGTAIDTLMATGDLHFGTHIRKAIPRAYLYVTKPGDLVLRTISYHYGQAQEHFYEITLRPEDTVGVHRLRLRREIRAEAWAFEIKNVNGGDFELQGAEVLPVLLTRRS